MNNDFRIENCHFPKVDLGFGILAYVEFTYAPDPRFPVRVIQNPGGKTSYINGATNIVMTGIIKKSDLGQEILIVANYILPRRVKEDICHDAMEMLDKIKFSAEKGLNETDKDFVENENLTSVEKA